LKPELITSLDQITPAWLTRVLGRSVAEVSFESGETSFCITAHIRVTYTLNSAAPTRFFLKFSKPVHPVTVPEGGWEVVFYQSVAPRTPSILAPCYDAVFSPEAALSQTPKSLLDTVSTGSGSDLINDQYAILPQGFETRFVDQVATAPCTDRVQSRNLTFEARPPEAGKLHLLLADLSATHYAELASQLPPTRKHSELIVKALAEVHAAWWEQPPWELIGWTLPDRAEVERRIQDVGERVALFANFLGDRLSDKRRAIYRDVFAALPKLYKRLMLPRAYTVIHDDIHLANVLYPRDGVADTVRLIDWQTWHIDLAPKDLAHMMAIFWFPERRRSLEQLLLRQYHDRLCANGVSNYSWDQLWYDYRLCVIRKLFHPPWQWASGIHPNIWWNHLERVMSAYDDLNCRELLET